MKYLLILLIFLPGGRIGMSNPRFSVYPRDQEREVVYRNHLHGTIIYLNDTILSTKVRSLLSQD